MQNKQVELKQQSLASVMRELHPTSRLALGIVFISILTRYAVLLPITWTGHFRNTLFDPFEGGIICGLLVAQSLISQKTKRDKQTAIAFCILLLLLTSLPVVLFKGWRNLFVYNWPSVVYPLVIFPLNRYLFLKYKKAVDLE